MSCQKSFVTPDASIHHLPVFFLPLFLFGAVLTTALCLLLLKLVMPWLKGKEQEDRDALANYEQDIQEAAGEGCFSWCNGRWAKQWCGNAVCGLPRSPRSSARCCGGSMFDRSSRIL